MSSNGHRTAEAARGDYARNGEIVAAATGQISTQLTTGTSTPALVAQALSGRWYLLLKLGLFGTLKLALALQFIVTNTYFSVACNTKISVRATLK